ncbi:MAG: hypothetical protein IJO87_05845 [Eggerthellaceae bacterium]|nr:hypothetical protein [Eggerthellaceae bacterium]
MKSTYKLIGAFWDRRETSEIATLPITPYDPCYPDVSTEKCLFDLLEYKRSIKLTMLLALEREEDLAEIALRLKDCNKVAICLDYIPLSHGTVHVSFYRLRVAQAIKALMKALPAETHICIMLPEEGMHAA